MRLIATPSRHGRMHRRAPAGAATGKGTGPGTATTPCVWAAGHWRRRGAGKKHGDRLVSVSQPRRDAGEEDWERLVSERRSMLITF